MRRQDTPGGSYSRVFQTKLGTPENLGHSKYAPAALRPQITKPTAASKYQRPAPVTTVRYFTNNLVRGPAPTHPDYAYERFVEPAPAGTYKRQDGRPSTSDMNIKLSSNDNQDLWRQLNMKNPCYCYEFMIYNRCQLGTECRYRHAPPSPRELLSLKWWNPWLWEDIEKGWRKNLVLATRLFPSMCTPTIAAYCDTNST